ncbi:MAG: HAD-IA family hydrolase [Clostridia bacterium]|nr:HAD-IA family hydrolase [Clostridia bacterium]
MKYKLIIFDLDGTVLDTLADLCDSVNFALKMHNLPERSIEEVRTFVGNGIRRLIDLAVPTGTGISLTDSVFEAFKLHYKDHSCDKTRPYDGINDLLLSLKKKGMLTAVVSNKADFAVKELVERYFPGMFSYFAGEKDGIPRKPAPDMVINAINSLNVSPDEAVYIGDSEVDVMTARNTGIENIIVTWGFRDEKALLEAGAKTLAGNVDSLKNLIL